MRIQAGWLVLAGALLAACGDDDGGSDIPAPTGLTIAKASPSGDEQAGTVGEALGDALRVTVTRAGAAEVGATIIWSTPDGGALDPSSTTTGADGTAQTSWTLGGAAGAQSAVATLQGATGSPLTFTATANAGPAARLVASPGPTGTVGTQVQLQVTTTDANNNGVGGVAVAWTVTAGDGVLAAPTSQSNAGGVATNSLTLPAAPGTVTVEAAATGLTGSPAAITATAVAGGGGGGGGGSTVTVGNNFFQPASITVPPGTTVTWQWTNTGAVPHNVTSTGSPSFPSSATLTGTGQTYQHRFETSGTYQYQCTIHPEMQGTVVVQ